MSTVNWRKEKWFYISLFSYKKVHLTLLEVNLNYLACSWHSSCHRCCRVHSLSLVSDGHYSWTHSHIFCFLLSQIYQLFSQRCCSLKEMQYLHRMAFASRTDTPPWMLIGLRVKVLPLVGLYAVQMPSNNKRGLILLSPLRGVIRNS